MNQLSQRLLTLLALSALCLAVGITLVAAQGPDNPIPTPQPEVDDARPTDVIATPTGDNAVVVVWKTAKAVAGWIEYGPSLDKLDGVAFDDRGQGVVDIKHQVTVKGLEPDTAYYYVIVSGEKKYDNAGSLFKVLTDWEVKPAELSVESLQGANVTDASTAWTQCQSTYEGIELCSDSTSQTFAVKVDTRNPNVRFKAVLANDNPANSVAPPVDSLTTKTVAQMASAWGAVVAINTDYFGPNHHGVEGLFYRDGMMLDNVSANYRGPLRPDSCDDNPGDPDTRVCRSSLAISSNNNANIGFGYRSGYMFNVVGGGPIFMRGGLYTRPAVTYYYSTRDSRSRMRLGGESPFDRDYFSETTRWTVAGLDSSGRYLVLMSVGSNRNAGFVVQQLQNLVVNTAIKFDGGGSTQFFYDGQLLVQGARSVPSALLVFSRRSTDPDDRRVISSGQTLNGTIDPANDEDTYYFDASQGQRATVRMNRQNTTLDSYLLLYAPNGSLVNDPAADDDRGGNNNAWIDRATLPQTGRYRILAKSYNGASSGPYSLSLILESGGVPPAAPSNLSATAVSSSQINLSWQDNSNNETGFKIERKTGASGTWSEIATVGAGVRTYQNTGLAANTTYCYRVRAYNSAGNSGYSNEPCATTGGQPPVAPSNLSATAVSSSQINLSWQDNSNNETGFKIERKTGAGGTWSEIATVGAGVRTYQNTGLAANTTYCYRVRAYNSAGNSGYSNEPCATTGCPTQKILSVTAIRQEQTNWCWAATAQAIMGFHGTSVRQCDLANWLFSQSTCCSNPGSAACNRAATNAEQSRVYSHWGFSNTPVNSSISFTTVKNEICNNRPIKFGWAWTGGGGHALTMRGYYDGTTDYVYYIDPGDASYNYNAYSWVVSGGNHTWSTTTYNIHK